MEALGLALWFVLGYGFGSIPWAYLAARRKGVDIGVVDTAIAGAANVYRSVGRVDGVLVFIADAAKGAAAVWFARQLGADGSLALAGAAGAVAGHMWPAFGRFPGGVGLAALGGATAVIGGWAGVVAIVAGSTMVGVLRNTGVGGGLGFAAYLLAGVAFGLEPVTIFGILVLAFLTLVKARVTHHLRTTRAKRA